MGFLEMTMGSEVSSAILRAGCRSRSSSVTGTMTVFSPGGELSGSRLIPPSCGLERVQTARRIRIIASRTTMSDSIFLFM